MVCGCLKGRGSWLMTFSRSAETVFRFARQSGTALRDVAHERKAVGVSYPALPLCPTQFAIVGTPDQSFMGGSPTSGSACCHRGGNKLNSRTWQHFAIATIPGDRGPCVVLVLVLGLGSHGVPSSPSSCWAEQPTNPKAGNVLETPRSPLRADRGWPMRELSNRSSGTGRTPVQSARPPVLGLRLYNVKHAIGCVWQV